MLLPHKGTVGSGIQRPAQPSEPDRRTDPGDPGHGGKDAYCIDILGQVAAASGALNSFTKVLLASHIRHCVAEDVREGSEEKLDELVRTLQKLMK